MSAILLAALLSLQSKDDAHIDLLKSIEPSDREAAAMILGNNKAVKAIPYLIDTLGKEQPEMVRVKAALVLALQKITGEKFEDHAAWDRWWKEGGRSKFPPTISTSEDVNRILQPRIDQLESKFNLITMILLALGAFFVLVMLYFVGHVSGKLREWKEIAKQTEQYLREGEEITKRTDKVLEELELKKVDIIGFIGKLKEENQVEMERFCDLLQQNTEHRVRDEVLAQRQKAEKELEETFTERRAAIEHEIRRSANEQHTRFLKEVEAHTIYLEASFLKASGKLEEAQRAYKRVVASQPNHAVAWNELGTVQRGLDRLDEAVESLKRGLEILPDDPRTLYNLAATYALQKKRREMLETLTLAVRNDGEYKDEALNDPAFREYWKDPEFRDLAEV